LHPPSIVNTEQQHAVAKTLQNDWHECTRSVTRIRYNCTWQRLRSRDWSCCTECWSKVGTNVRSRSLKEKLMLRVRTRSSCNDWILTGDCMSRYRQVLSGLVCVSACCCSRISSLKKRELVKFLHMHTSVYSFKNVVNYAVKWKIPPFLAEKAQIDASKLLVPKSFVFQLLVAHKSRETSKTF